MTATREDNGQTAVTLTDPALVTVAPQGVALRADSRDSDVYDGAEKTVTGFACSVTGLTLTGVSASGSGTNAGRYPVAFTGAKVNETRDDTGNYVVASLTEGLLTNNSICRTVNVTVR